MMDRLSVELIRIICSFLIPSDVGRLRRASRFYANVGRPFMFQQLHLVFTPDSFERLRAISSDPTLAPHITSLFYEADTLPVCEEMEHWQSFLGDSAGLLGLEFIYPPSPDNSSERARRAYRREVDQLENLKSTRYQKFLKYLDQQDAMRKDSYHAGKIADAMFHLPNLEAIILSFEYWAGGASKAARNPYSDSLVVPYGHNSRTEPRGVPQMLSLLQGSADTQIKLKTLCGGVIDWKFFKQSDEVFKDLQKAVRNVRELELEFSTSPGIEEAEDLIRNSDGDELESEILECAGYLKNGRLKELLAAAPNLKRLDLRFDSTIPSWIQGCPVDLRYVLGKHKWGCLADVTLSFLGSRAEDLVDFCETHAFTLQRLVMHRISLVEGSWSSTFQQMRLLLHLKQVRVRGLFEAFDECWNFAKMGSSVETELGRVVQEYLLEGGDGPLLDLNQYIYRPRQY